MDRYDNLRRLAMRRIVPAVTIQHKGSGMRLKFVEIRSNDCASHTSVTLYRPNEWRLLR